MSDAVSVLGGSGFVGRFLLERWPAEHRGKLRFLLHRSRPAWLDAGDADVRPIDLADPRGVRAALEGTGCVVNLLRPDGGGWLRASMERLLPTLAEAGVPRLVHASSIDVYGGAGASHLTEETPPEPRTPYEREHEAMERLVARAPFSTCVVRLGAVFGPGGRNLVAFVPEMRNGPIWKLAARRSLYGGRRMHLVSVENVADAIGVLATSRGMGKNTILVTDDEAVENNFAFVQDAMARVFGRSGLDRVPELPAAALRAVLRARGRAGGDPMRRFSGDRLAATGFRPERGFADRVDGYLTLLRDMVDGLRPGPGAC